MKKRRTRRYSPKITELRGIPTMSTSTLYHAFGLKGVKYIRTKYEKGLLVFHAVEGNGGQDITPFLKFLRKKALDFEAIAMDMNTGFSSAVEKHLPDIPIVFDHYHVSALMNKAIEEVRREQQSRLDEEGNRLSREAISYSQKTMKTSMIKNRVGCSSPLKPIPLCRRFTP